MEARNLAVTFRQRRRTVRAIDGVSLEWRPGEILGIVGESGCGKSTLARAMLGLQERSGGEVLLDGAPVTGRTGTGSLRRRIQMIFQDPYQTLNPRQKIGQIVAEPLVVQKVPKEVHRERIGQAMRDVGLDPDRFLDRYPHQLSGGQRQRAAIAAALVLEPDGLICDEPTSMLDVSVRAQILSVLLALRESRGLALIFITHDLSLAWSLCDRTLVMYLGRIVEQGYAVDVIERPKHPYTEALVAAVPGTAARDDGSGRLPRGELPDPAGLPAGCRFHPRCPKRFEPCDRVDPDLYPAGGKDQLAACLLYGGVPDLPAQYKDGEDRPA